MNEVMHLTNGWHYKCDSMLVRALSEATNCVSHLLEFENSFSLLHIEKMLSWILKDTILG